MVTYSTKRCTTAAVLGRLLIRDVAVDPDLASWDYERVGVLIGS